MQPFRFREEFRSWPTHLISVDFPPEPKGIIRPHSGAFDCLGHFGASCCTSKQYLNFFCSSAIWRRRAEANRSASPSPTSCVTSTLSPYDRSEKLVAVGLGPLAIYLAEHLLAALGPELAHLGVHALTVGRDPGVALFHGRDFATELCNGKAVYYQRPRFVA